MSRKEISIGIDLGTTFSCVAVMRNGQPEVLEDQGRRITASIVSFDPKTGQEIVGDAAKRQMTINSKNTFYVTKRFMGMANGAEKEILKDHPVSYDIVEGTNGIEFKTENGNRYKPQVIAAKILSKMKAIAASDLGVPIEDIKSAVITVPAYFNDDQRHATKIAGEIAGLKVLRIINEPTAAALAYGMNKKKNCKLAVFDLGGGTFDVSILEIDENVFEVKASVGDPFLGGTDFDQRIVDYVVNEFKKDKGIDLTRDVSAISRIREEAEKAKIALSSALSVDINLPFITMDSAGPLHLNISLTRAKFESLCQDLIEKTEGPCRQAIKDAKINTSEIDEILLVGGMTRMPKISEIVEKIFGKPPLKTINPDEAVAKGAAIQAGIINKDEGLEDSNVLLLDVTPISLGIETLGGVFTPLIPRQTTIPVQKKQVFSTAFDNQTGVTIMIYQGERPMAKDNKMLGQFTLDGIAPAPKGVPQIEVCFDIDANGIINVSAMDLNTKKAQKINIAHSNHMTQEEVAKNMEEARLYEEQDKKALKLIEAKNKADITINSAEKTVKEYQEKVDVSIITEINNVKDQLNTAKAGDDITEIERLIDELNKSLQKVGESVYKKQGDEQTQGAEQTDSSNTEETKKSEPEVEVE